MSEKKNLPSIQNLKTNSNINEISLEDQNEIIINQRDIQEIKYKINQLKDYKKIMNQKVDEIEECKFILK
jgi:hypothetical protein